MLNMKLTAGDEPSKINMSRKYKPLIDHEGKYLCGISSNSIVDLNGNTIAFFKCIQKQLNNKNELVKVRVYESKFGIFKVYNDVLYLNDSSVAKFIGGKKKGLGILLASIALLILTLAIILLIDVPDRSNTFTIVFKDGNTNQSYVEGKTIGVFSPSIHPGSNGEYKFSINNTENVEVTYSFDIQEFYNDNKIDEFPIEYRLKMNNLYIADSKSWLDGKDLEFVDLIVSAKSTEVFTLEWRWPFESGDDVTDTLYGSENGQYSLVMNLTASYYNSGE